MEKKMLGNVQIDSNFYAKLDVKILFDFINEKMVHNITIKSFQNNSISNYYTSYLIVETVQLGYGKSVYDFIVKDLNEHNTNLLHEYISAYLNSK